MTNLARLAAALAATSVVVLSAQAAHAVVLTPPRPTINIPAVRPPAAAAVTAVRPMPVVHPGPTMHCKCGGIPNHIHPTPPPTRWPVAAPVPPKPQPVTVTVNSTSSKPASFGGKPVTATTTVSNFQGPAGNGSQTTTVFTDGNGHAVGAISAAALNPSSAATKPAPAIHPAPAIVYKPGSAPAPVAPAPASTSTASHPAAPQPGTVPVQTSSPAPAATPKAPASTPAPATHAAPSAGKPAVVAKPVLYPAFTDQYKKPVGYYKDGQLVMGTKGPNGGNCSPTIGYQTPGGSGVSGSYSPGMVQVTAMQCYVNG